MALLAKTTLGSLAGTVRAEVKTDAVADDGSYRLVVQSYDSRDGKAKPVGSVQRAVTGAELRKGVRIDLVELRDAPANSSDDSMVVAWVEVGDPDLEFDGRMARPQPGSVYGAVRRSTDVVQISLDRKTAA
jgi:hypothetical protein